MANFFAYFMLAVWPAIGIFIIRKKGPDDAVILLFLVPYLILPPIINLPITSSLDKSTIPSIAALLIMRSKYGRMKLQPNSQIIKLLIFLLVLSPFLTFYYNRDPIVFPNKTIPGLTVKDVINMEFHNFCWRYIPLILGYTWLGNPKSHRKLLAIISVAGLIYSIPMLWEVRMSPQLNFNFYGFYPGGFDQQIRAGGFRPVVFLEHGLRVAVFFAMSITATIAIHKLAMRENKKTENKGRLKLLYMFAVIFLCKTWSAIIYTAIAQALILATKPRAWIKFSIIVVTIVFIFPYLRSSEWVPTHTLSSFFSQYNSERAGSLQYRFDNEDILLKKANERPLTGWGGWGRSRIYNEWGQDISVQDGEWIILFGTTGWIGYAAGFGLIFFPALLAYRKISEKKDMEIPICTAGIFIIIAFNMIDLVPNSSISPLTYLLSGTLLGYANWLSLRCPIFDRSTKLRTRNQRVAIIRHGSVT